MNTVPPPEPAGRRQRLRGSVQLRLAGAALAIAAGSTAVVLAILLVRSALS